MALKDLGDYLDDDSLEVPVNGKVYKIAAPDADTGMYLVALAQVAERNASGGEITPEELASLSFDDGRELDFTRLVLGDTYDELRADKVSLIKISRLTQYAFVYYTMGEKVADRMASPGEAPAPNRTTRRAASRAGANATKPRASTAGTTSTRKPARRSKAS